MTPTHPKVSVIVPAHNAAGFLEAALASVSAQTEPDFEVLAIDDHSTDGTRPLIARLAARDPRIHPIYRMTNGGAAAARNDALDQARGTYVAFLDADDVWHPDKLASQIAWMEQHQSLFSCTAYTRINAANGRQIDVIPPKHVTFDDLRKTNSIACSTVMCRRDALGDKRFPDFRLRQDHGLWLDLLKDIAACDGLETVLTTYHQRPGSLSNNLRDRLYWSWKLYRQHLRLSPFTAAHHLITHLAAARKRRK